LNAYSLLFLTRKDGGFLLELQEEAEENAERGTMEENPEACPILGSSP